MKVIWSADRVSFEFGDSIGSRVVRVEKIDDDIELFLDHANRPVGLSVLFADGKVPPHEMIQSAIDRLDHSSSFRDAAIDMKWLTAASPTIESVRNAVWKRLDPMRKVK